MTGPMMVVLFCFPSSLSGILEQQRHRQSLYAEGCVISACSSNVIWLHRICTSYLGKPSSFCFGFVPQSLMRPQPWNIYKTGLLWLSLLSHVVSSLPYCSRYSVHILSLHSGMRHLRIWLSEGKFFLVFVLNVTAIHFIGITKVHDIFAQTPSFCVPFSVHVPDESSELICFFLSCC